MQLQRKEKTIARNDNLKKIQVKMYRLEVGNRRVPSATEPDGGPKPFILLVVGERATPATEYFLTQSVAG